MDWVALNSGLSGSEYLEYSDKTRNPSYLSEKVIHYVKTHAIQEEK